MVQHGHRASAGRTPSSRIANFANWTDRIAAGELPFAKPERPQGVERNVVITQWDWADPKVYLHDQVSTDKRKPTVNAYGKNYGVDGGKLGLLPGPRSGDQHRHQGQDAGARRRHGVDQEQHHGAVGILGRRGDLGLPRTSMHNPMMDERGDVWFTSRVGKPDNPAFCQAGSDASVRQAVPAQGIDPASRLCTTRRPATPS